MTEPVNPYFDPDDIHLTKPMLVKMINGIITRWQKDEKKHRIQITQLKAFRLSLRFQSEDSVGEVVKQIILMVNAMQRYNAMLRLRGEQPKTETLLNLAIQKIEAGDYT